jgi:hypothetical protein
MNQQRNSFTLRELEDAQHELDFHPDASPFWDSNAGQDVLYVARRAGLEPRTTNRERCALYAAQRAKDEREAITKARAQ